MIDFWARIDESDVEKFAKTLILPAYMSHLKIAPFSLSDQVRVATGREPLKIVYLGEGRLEELSLEPDRYAERLLASLSVGLDVEKIRLPTSGAVWTWNEVGPTHPFYTRTDDEKSGENGVSRLGSVFNAADKTAPENDALRNDSPTDAATEEPNPPAKFISVYFERKAPLRETQTFSARDAYVSVSRREMFVSWRVVESCARASILDLLKRSRPQPLKKAPSDGEIDALDETDRVDFAWNRSFQPFDEKFAEKIGAKIDVPAPRPTFPLAPPTSFENEFEAAPRELQKYDFCFELDGRRAMFRCGQIAGSFALDSSEFLDEAFRFAGLNRSLTYLDEYVRRVPQTFEPELDESGVRVRLSVVETKKSGPNAS